MPEDAPVRAPMTARLKKCPDVAAGIRWPFPLEERLKQLVSMVEDEAGENTTKTEVVAALILAAPEDGEKLAGILRRYRLASVGDAIVGSDAGVQPNIIEFQRGKVGRPKKRFS
jgi:hypothetical protein